VRDVARAKLFAQLDNHHHGADRLAVWLPAALGVQELRDAYAQVASPSRAGRQAKR